MNSTPGLFSTTVLPAYILRFPGSGQNRPQALPGNQFLARLDRHRNELQPVGLPDFFLVRIRIALTNRWHQARVVGAEHFDYRIALAQLPDAVGDAESPPLVVPGDSQRRVAIPVSRDVNLGRD